ncbi:MAG: hypothetical protein ACR2P5_08495 [Gammaproteobacteria bacterium]
MRFGIQLQKGLGALAAGFGARLDGRAAVAAPRAHTEKTMKTMNFRMYQIAGAVVALALGAYAGGAAASVADGAAQCAERGLVFERIRESDDRIICQFPDAPKAAAASDCAEGVLTINPDTNEQNCVAKKQQLASGSADALMEAQTIPAQLARANVLSFSVSQSTDSMFGNFSMEYRMTTKVEALALYSYSGFRSSQTTQSYYHRTNADYWVGENTKWYAMYTTGFQDVSYSSRDIETSGFDMGLSRTNFFMPNDSYKLRISSPMRDNRLDRNTSITAEALFGTSDSNLRFNVYQRLSENRAGITMSYRKNF